MLLTLGMIVKNEARFLQKILPLFASLFDEIVAVDAESTDETRKILSGFGARVIIRPWTNDYAAARNAVIANAKSEWMFMLDADEALFPQHIDKIKTHLRMSRSDAVIYLPRIEFVDDFNHYDDRVYPDNQGRIFRLGKGFEYRNPIHESLYREGSTKSEWELNRHVVLDRFPIYHYGQCKPPAETWLRHHNYGLVQRGLPPLAAPPEGFVPPQRAYRKEFTGDHPLKGLA